MIKYKQLGTNGPKVSAIAMGTLYISQNQLPLFNAAFELGINHFDTADCYNDGASDLLLATFLKGKEREKIVLSSKVFYPTNFGKTASGLSKAHILESVDLSLKRLKTDYLDVLYLHRFDSETPFTETLDALQMLFESGKIKHWGISAFSTFQLCKVFYDAKAQHVATPIAAQYAYNLFNRNIELELNEALTALNISVVAYYGLAQGVLSGKYKNGEVPINSRANKQIASKSMWDFTPDKLEKSKAFSEFCEDKGQDTAATALAWCLQNRRVASVLTHVSSLEQLHQNVRALNIAFADEDLLRLQEIFDNKPLNLYTKVAY